MTLDEAQALDAIDPLAGFRDRFRLPPGLLYLDGNSLGPPPRLATERLDDLVGRQWGARLIRGWNEEGWADAPARVGARIARLVGADADEVIVADSTSVCLFKLLAAALALRPGAIAAQARGFPTDHYLAAELAAERGRPFRGVVTVADAIGPDVAAAVLSHVDYRDGDRLDMAALSAAADRAGTALVWDLSHSVGAVPVDLHGAGAALAVGCGYKYLNGGPGAPAFLYVRRDWHARLPAVVAGWWAHARPFAFADRFEPAPGIARFLSGTPPVLALAALEAGVETMLAADQAALHAKAAALWDLFVGEVEARCPALALRTPRAPDCRGSHASFAHPHALAISRALTGRGVIGDHRPPDLLRFGFTPLYQSHAEVWRAAGILAEVVATEAWRDPRFQAGGVVP